MFLLIHYSNASLSSSEGASEVSPTSNCDNENSGMNSMVEQHNMSAVGGIISLDDLNGSNEETTNISLLRDLWDGIPY